ncbi:hypothetical protein F4782DRAFT_518633 [Xylaria castorea]|nr:hypothetical protein F4782DRAFT_518633 [Xylaria castorea]
MDTEFVQGLFGGFFYFVMFRLPRYMLWGICRQELFLLVLFLGFTTTRIVQIGAKMEHLSTVIARITLGTRSTPTVRDK